MSAPLDPRATEFTTAAGIELWVLPLQIGEPSPLGPKRVPELEPSIQIFYRQPNADGSLREQITYGLSSLQSYVATLLPSEGSQGGTRGSVDYSWQDHRGLLDIAEKRFGIDWETIKATPRSRLSGLAERAMA